MKEYQSNCGDVRASMKVKDDYISIELKIGSDGQGSIPCKVECKGYCPISVIDDLCNSQSIKNALNADVGIALQLLKSKYGGAYNS